MLTRYLEFQISQSKDLSIDGRPPTIHHSEERDTTEQSDSPFHQQMATHNVKLLGEKALASGNFGSVWKGVWNGELVAVKQVGKGLLAQLQNEVTIMRYVFLSRQTDKLRSVNHIGLSVSEQRTNSLSGIVKFKKWIESENVLIMEFVPNGTLHNCLRNLSQPIGISDDTQA